MVSGQGTLDALNTRTGHKEWSTGTNLDTYVAPVVSRNIVYVRGSSALYAFDARTGAHLWSFVDGAAPFSWLVGDGHVYVGGFMGSYVGLVALNARTGVQTWDYRQNVRETLGPLAINRGLIYVASYIEEPVGSDYNHNQLLAFNAASGSLVWSKGGIGPGGILIRHGVIYGWGYYRSQKTDSAPGLVAVNTFTGAQIWVDPHAGGSLSADLTISDQALIYVPPPYGFPVPVTGVVLSSGRPSGPIPAWGPSTVSRVVTTSCTPR